MTAIALIQRTGLAASHRRHFDSIEIEDFDIDSGSLRVEACFAFDVNHEEADPSTGYTRETWDVEGEIVAIKVSGLIIRRNTSDPYNCDLLSFISEQHDYALSDLTRYEEALCDQIRAEYESGERTIGHAIAAE